MKTLIEYLNVLWLSVVFLLLRYKKYKNEKNNI